MGFLDPGELGCLAAGEIPGVLPQRVPGGLEVPGVTGGDADRPAAMPDRLDGPRPAGGAPDLAADLVEGAGGPGDDVERVSAQDRLRRAAGGRPGDPVRAVSGQVGEQPAAFLAELIEEGVHGAGLAAGRGPDQQPGVVIDHDDQVYMAAFIGDLVSGTYKVTPFRTRAWPWMMAGVPGGRWSWLSGPQSGDRGICFS